MQWSRNGPGKCSWAVLSNASVASNCCPLLSILRRAYDLLLHRVMPSAMLITVLIIKISTDLRRASVNACYCYEHYFHFSVRCFNLVIAWPSTLLQVLTSNDFLLLHTVMYTTFLPKLPALTSIKCYLGQANFSGVTKILSSYHTLKTPFPTPPLFGSATLIH